MGNNYVSDTGWRNTQIAGKLYEKLKDSVKIKVYMARRGSFQVSAHD